MLTRSQSRNTIDFISASKAWNSNKMKLGNGCYEYTSVKKSVRPSHSYNTRSVKKI